MVLERSLDSAQAYIYRNKQTEDRQGAGRIHCRGRKAGPITGTETEQAGQGHAGLKISPKNAGETSTDDIEQSGTD